MRNSLHFEEKRNLTGNRSLIQEKFREGSRREFLEQLRELAVHLGDNNIEVLAYLREQADILQSGLLQQIKTLSNEISLRELVKPLALWKEPLHDWLRSDTRDYHRLLLTWQMLLCCQSPS